MSRTEGGAYQSGPKPVIWLLPRAGGSMPWHPVQIDGRDGAQ